METAPVPERQVGEPLLHLPLRARQVAVREPDARPVRGLDRHGLLPLERGGEADVMVLLSVRHEQLDRVLNEKTEVVIRGVRPVLASGAGADGAVVGWHGDVDEAVAQRRQHPQGLGVHPLHGANLVRERQVVRLLLLGDVAEALGRVPDIGENDLPVSATRGDVGADVVQHPGDTGHRLGRTAQLRHLAELVVGQADDTGAGVKPLPLLATGVVDLAVEHGRQVVHAEALRLLGLHDTGDVGDLLPRPVLKADGPPAALNGRYRH